MLQDLFNKDGIHPPAVVGKFCDRLFDFRERKVGREMKVDFVVPFICAFIG